MPFVTYNVDIGPAVKGLTTFAAILQDRLDDAAEQTAKESLFRIQVGMYWTNRSGKTAASFKSTRVKSGHWRVQSKNKIATFLDKGTVAHVIEARKAGALRFVVNGSVRFAKRVFHPGTKPLRYEEGEATLSEPVLAARADKAAMIAADLSGLLWRS